MRAPQFIAAVAFLAACSGRDPILDRADARSDTPAAQPGGHTTTQPNAPKRGTAAEPKPVKPPEPSPADPGAPKPGSADQPKPVQPGQPPPPGEAGGIALSGVVVLDDHKGGQIRVDVFDGDQKAASGGGKRPGVVAMARLDSPGPFSVSVPAGTDRVWIGAFADEDQDGKPGPLDPEVWYAANPVSLKADTADIQLVLERRAPPPK